MTADNYNKDSCDAIYIERATYKQLQEAGAGAFTYWYDADGKVKSMACRDPANRYGHLPLRPKEPGGPDAWRWDGNVEKPTLTPSVHCKPVAPRDGGSGTVGWHGHLTKGKWVSQ